MIARIEKPYFHVYKKINKTKNWIDIIVTFLSFFFPGFVFKLTQTKDEQNKILDRKRKALNCFI